MSEIPAEILPSIQDLLNIEPVDVMQVARRLGLVVFQEELKPGISGVLLRDHSYGTRSGFAILVNQNEAYVRQRFTAAHEIGHFVLHRNIIGDRIEDNYMLRSDGISNRLEQQANRFAADVLMPFPLLNRLIQGGLRTVAELAATMKVSEIAMAIRLDHPT